ncbi:unnamed protein product [Moneuplotes crassus]|uniref:Uncharacterized protein n=1 Tax=Euplotes crassus TaxID=5936 RepID=A0AAD1UTW1_EUPCR|nr:unnamed protein product [Moneuplotes crassus]
MQASSLQSWLYIESNLGYHILEVSNLVDFTVLSGAHLSEEVSLGLKKEFRAESVAEGCLSNPIISEKDCLDIRRELLCMRRNGSLPFC